MDEDTTILKSFPSAGAPSKYVTPTPSVTTHFGAHTETASNQRSDDPPDSPRKRRPRRRLLAIIAAVLIVGSIAAILVPRLIHSTPQVSLYTVSTATLHATIGGGGLTYAAQSLNIVYPVAANVTAVNVQVGQSVTKGQRLITLNNDNLTIQLQQAYAQWQNDVQYVNTLLWEGAAPTSVAAAQQQAANAKAAYDALNALLNSPTYQHGNIVSPFPGVVSAINVTAGSTTTPGSTLVTVSDLSSVIVRAQFPIADFPYLQLKQQATVIPASTPGQSFTGTVTTVNPILTNAGANTFEVWVTVPNPSKQLFGNESVFARVQTTETLVVVPELAVINPDGESIIFVYQNGVAHLRHVTVAVRDGDQFGIASGLTQGDQVILTGQYNLHDNQPVSTR